MLLIQSKSTFYFIFAFYYLCNLSLKITFAEQHIHIMYKLLLRPILFCFDPEKVHYFTFSLVKFISKIPFVTSIIKAIYVVEDKRLEREVFGLKFKNPVGLAAGFDKDAKLVYHGAIDDNANDADAVTRNHLKEAINEVVDSKEVTIKQSRSVGCTIKRKS